MPEEQTAAILRQVISRSFALLFDDWLAERASRPQPRGAGQTLPTTVTADGHTAPASEEGDEHERTGAMEESTIKRFRYSCERLGKHRSKYDSTTSQISSRLEVI